MSERVKSREATIKIHSSLVQKRVLYCPSSDSAAECSFMSQRPAPVPSGTLAVYRFERFTLDLGKGSLSSDSEVVKLRPKAFEALRYMVERSGRLISKDELTNAVWPDSFVSDNSLAQCFLEIRKALQDDNQRIIKTVARRGYLFNVPVERVLAQPIQNVDKPLPVQPPVRLAGRIAGAVTLVTVSIAVVLWLFASRHAPPSTPVSMAVLPFQSLEQSQPDEFLQLGMADALITRLSNLRQLVVRPTSTVRMYMDRGRDPVEIGKRLKVTFVVEGSVQQKGDRIRVSIQLIRVHEGRPIWAERYDEPSSDIFAVQDAISTRVASSLALKVTGEEASRLQKKPTSDLQAFQFYLRGRYFWDRRTKEDLNKALDYYSEAIHRDPQFTLAYAAAAQCYPPMILLGFAPRAEALNEMHSLVDRALELDVNMADAVVSKASLKMFEWDWPGAEQSFHRAIALNPNDPLAHIWYGFYLDAMGRQEENLAERKRALELDPLSWNANAGVGAALGALGKHDEAIQFLRSAIELNPNFVFTRLNLGKEYLATGRPDLAIAEFQVVQDLPSLGYAFAVNGQRKEAERVLDQLRQDPLTNSLDIAIVNAGLGRTSEALDGLEQAQRSRNPWLMFLRVDGRLSSLRGNPRFEAIAAGMNIPKR
jgi:TolB-like protein/DNA-binding winged helix-turn-helix (wHTH) protein/tetratricopeptide (TPR) repeat protein